MTRPSEAPADPTAYADAHRSLVRYLTCALALLNGGDRLELTGFQRGIFEAARGDVTDALRALDLARPAPETWLPRPSGSSLPAPALPTGRQPPGLPEAGGS